MLIPLLLHLTTLNFTQAKGDMNRMLTSDLCLQEIREKLSGMHSSESLEKAQNYEQTHQNEIDANRPFFHLTPRTGWMNDPNGFCFYDGKYHLFYQYYPYETVWGPMHWGHAVSKDLLHWEYLPAVMAPDAPYETGCFSGSAIEQDGLQVILYTSHYEPENGNCRTESQSLAFGDGTKVLKYEHNPVVSSDSLPEGMTPTDFRDPKIWKDGDHFYFVAGCSKDQQGCILLYQSQDLIHWDYKGVLHSQNHMGFMWECPDFFPIRDKHVLICSPMGVEKDTIHHQFEGDVFTAYTIGDFDPQTLRYDAAPLQELDAGLDFYAPQTTSTPDGRRILIGWLQNWCKNIHHAEKGFAGSMTIPRELSIRDGKLIQQPVWEVNSLRKNKVERNMFLGEEPVILPEVSGRVIDLDLDWELLESESVTLCFAKGMGYETRLTYCRKDNTLTYDRSLGGSDLNSLQICANPERINRRTICVSEPDGHLKLRILLDKYSAEIFVNGGEQVMSFAVYTPMSAEIISFQSEGESKLYVCKWDLN